MPGGASSKIHARQIFGLVCLLLCVCAGELVRAQRARFCRYALLPRRCCQSPAGRLDQPWRRRGTRPVRGGSVRPHNGAMPRTSRVGDAHRRPASCAHRRPTARIVSTFARSARRPVVSPTTRVSSPPQAASRRSPSSMVNGENSSTMATRSSSWHDNATFSKWPTC